MSSNDLHKLERELYDARESNGMDALHKYATTKVAALCEQLLVSDLDKVRELQGEAKAYKDIITVLEKPPFDLT